ncbi:MAG: hypothetical protein AAB660_01110 [Patescibacteria group bacterium]
MGEINGRRAQTLADDLDDDLSDSFFEAPPIDSDEHIIHELLEEKQSGSSASTAV